MAHMRSEYFQGNGVTDQKSREKWEQDGGLDARKRARAIVRTILAQEEKPYIPKDIDHAIRERFDILL
jgi:trimethylamine--corrinoid protein Co-methyltransferase